ncbi:pmpB, partial [Symbiodinium pilosum]
PFLPGGGSMPIAVAKVLGGLALCLAAALFTWLQMCRSTEDPPPSHVLFLTGKYKEPYRFFETERLLRKTAITFIGGLLPIAASPALQMGCLGVIVLISLTLYMFCQPYNNKAWNRTEISLLLMSAFLIVIVAT